MNMLKQNKITQDKLKRFAQENSFKARMTKGGLDSYDNYIGDDLSDGVIVLSRGRDSDILSESNFEVALDMLGGEGRFVEVHRFGHWACGWVESIIVNPKSKAKLKIAYQIKESLSDYCVLDDSDYSERENDAIEETIKDNMCDFKRNLINFIGIKEDEELEDIDSTRNIESFLAAVFHEDCSYHGYDDAWVTDQAIIRSVTREHGDCAYDCKDYPIFKACLKKLNKAA